MDNFLEITEKCPIKSLIELKHGKYAGSIHTISADKLFIHYWTPTQLIVYKHVQKSYCRLLIDATGSLVKKLKRTKQNILSSHIFLYEGVINTINYQLKSSSNSLVEGDRISPYFLPEFTKNILRLCKEFPSWSNIMSPVFKSPYECVTSAAVEGDFSTKNNILKQNTTTMTVDRFLVTHLKSIENSMKIARSSQLQENNFHEIHFANKIKKPISRMSPVSLLNFIPSDKEYESDETEYENKHEKNQRFIDKN